MTFYGRMRPADHFTRVYVPLCGKTEDMAWLYNKGLYVVGSDIAEEAGYEFAAQHPEIGLARKIVNLPDGSSIIVYEAGL